MCRPFVFFNDTATTEIYTLSLHDALPIYGKIVRWAAPDGTRWARESLLLRGLKTEIDEQVRLASDGSRSEEHTSELQSRQYLVCRLLLEKKQNHRAQERARLNCRHRCLPA